METPSTSDPWAKCFELQEAAETVDVTVVGFNKGGLIVETLGLRGFMPYAQIDPSRMKPGHQGDFSFMQGVKMQARILLVDVQGNRKSLVLSERQVLIAEAMSRLNQGDVVRGVVTRLEDYGAFVRLEDYPPVQGLVQLGEISWNKVLTADSQLYRGQQVQAVVLDVSPAKCRLSLSLKRLQADPLKETVGTVDWKPATAPLPEVAAVMERLQQQEGISGVTLEKQAVTSKAVSQELELWLTKEELEGGYNVVVREGAVQQQIKVATALPRQQVVVLLQKVLRSSAAASLAERSS